MVDTGEELTLGFRHNLLILPGELSLRRSRWDINQPNNYNNTDSKGSDALNGHDLSENRCTATGPRGSSGIWPQSGNVPNWDAVGRLESNSYFAKSQPASSFSTGSCSSPASPFSLAVLDTRMGQVARKRA